MLVFRYFMLDFSSYLIYYSEVHINDRHSKQIGIYEYKSVELAASFILMCISNAAIFSNIVQAFRYFAVYLLIKPRLKFANWRLTIAI